VVVAVRAEVIAPVVPPMPPVSGRAAAPGVVALVRGPLPLPSLISRRTSTVIYGVGAELVIYVM
jgi:hypothetical protein